MSLRERVVTRHELQRAAERYDIDLTPDDVREIQALIRSHDPRAVVLAPQRDDSHLVAIHRDGRWLACIVDERSTIITFLPSDRLDVYRSFLDGIDPATGLPKAPEPEPEPKPPRAVVSDAVVLFRPDPAESAALKSKLRPAGTMKVKAAPTPKGSKSSPTVVPCPYGDIPPEYLPASDETEAIKEAIDRVSSRLVDMIRWGVARPEIEAMIAVKKTLASRLWWAEYRDLVGPAQVERATDADGLLEGALAAIKDLCRRLGWENKTERDEAIANLLCRWRGRAKHGEPPTDMAGLSPNRGEEDAT
jgi:hypothetical protein